MVLWKCICPHTDFLLFCLFVFAFISNLSGPNMLNTKSYFLSILFHELLMLDPQNQESRQNMATWSRPQHLKNQHKSFPNYGNSITEFLTSVQKGLWSHSELWKTTVIAIILIGVNKNSNEPLSLKWKNIQPTARYGSVMLCSGFAPSWSQNQCTMKMPKGNLRPTVGHVQLKCVWVNQKSNIPTLELLSQGLDLNSFGMLCHDLSIIKWNNSTKQVSQNWCKIHSVVSTFTVVQSMRFFSELCAYYFNPCWRFQIYYITCILLFACYVADVVEVFGCSICW